ncbi:MAG: hypothetical protein HY243_11465 [Proteobacteria bacterium]|nr:hypothetical protein [Pseudomonadota bacterium]
MTKRFTVAQVRDRDLLGDYVYEISRDGRKVAELSHNHRGEDFFLRLTLGDWLPVEKILTGGGPEPLKITEPGTKLLEELLQASLKKFLG